MITRQRASLLQVQQMTPGKEGRMPIRTKTEVKQGAENAGGTDLASKLRRICLSSDSEMEDDAESAQSSDDDDSVMSQSSADSAMDLSSTDEECASKKESGIVKTSPRVLIDDLLAEEVIQLIKGGDLKKLKLDHCRSYLRNHGMRVSGNKPELIDRIKQHIELKGGTSGKYLSSTFTIDCTGDVCKGDVIKFKQKVYKKYSTTKRSADALGERVVVGRVVKESYGEKKQQHTFTVEVLWSAGYKPLAPMRQLLVKGRNLYKLRTYRQEWEDEALRKLSLDEKHERGTAARTKRRETLRASGPRGIAVGTKKQLPNPYVGVMSNGGSKVNLPAGWRGPASNVLRRNWFPRVNIPGQYTQTSEVGAGYRVGSENLQNVPNRVPQKAIVEMPSQLVPEKGENVPPTRQPGEPLVSQRNIFSAARRGDAISHNRIVKADLALERTQNGNKSTLDCNVLSRSENVNYQKNQIGGVVYGIQAPLCVASRYIPRADHFSSWRHNENMSPRRYDSNEWGRSGNHYNNPTREALPDSRAQPPRTGYFDFMGADHTPYMRENLSRFPWRYYPAAWGQVGYHHNSQTGDVIFDIQPQPHATEGRNFVGDVSWRWPDGNRPPWREDLPRYSEPQPQGQLVQLCSSCVTSLSAPCTRPLTAGHTSYGRQNLNISPLRQDLSTSSGGFQLQHPGQPDCSGSSPKRPCPVLPASVFQVPDGRHIGNRSPLRQETRSPLHQPQIQSPRARHISPLPSEHFLCVTAGCQNQGSKKCSFKVCSRCCKEQRRPCANPNHKS